jgi:hypothetical protein
MQLGTAAGPDSCWEPTCVGGSPHHTAVVAIYCQQQPLGQTYCNALRAGLWEQWGSSCVCCKPYSNRPFLGHSSSSQPDMRRAMDTGLPPAAILLISWVLINSRNARSWGLLHGTQQQRGGVQRRWQLLVGGHTQHAASWHLNPATLCYAGGYHGPLCGV